MVKLITPNDPEELLEFEANLSAAQQKQLPAKSKHKKYIEVRGICQYRVRVRLKGKPSQSVTCHTLAGAERAVEDILNRSVDLGSSTVEHEMLERRRAAKKTLGELLQSRTAKDSAESSRIKIISDHKVSRISLTALKPEHFNIYINDRLSLELAQGTVRREMHLIASTLSKAVKQFPSALKCNPASAKYVDYPEDSPGRTRRLTAEEEQGIRKSFEGSETSSFLPTMFKIAISLGMRQGEIRDLEWKDINREDTYIFIPITKTNRPRSVPLTDEVEEALFDVWLPSRIKLAKEHGIALPERVFWAWNNGHAAPTTSEAIKSAWRRMRAKTEIEDLKFHDLRHEATSRLFEDHGLSLIEVASITGHTTNTMVERYTHLSANKLARKLRNKAIKTDMFFSEEEIEFLKSENENMGKIGIEEIVRLCVRQAMRRKNLARTPESRFPLRTRPSRIQQSTLPMIVPAQANRGAQGGSSMVFGRARWRGH